MSFKCDFCNVAQPARSAPVRVVTKQRAKRYSNTHKEHLVESNGWEIASEAEICQDCNNKQQQVVNDS